MPALLKKRDEQIEKLIEHVRPQVADDAWDQAHTFLKSCLEDYALDDLRRYGAGYLGDVSLSLFEAIQQRRPGDLDLTLENPEGQDHTVIEILGDDRPFLVDSMTEHLKRRGLQIHLAVHPQVAVRRDERGHLLEILPLGTEIENGVQYESLMHFHVDRQRHQADRVELETGLRRVLADIETSVADWRLMHDACVRAADSLREQPKEPWVDNLDEVIAFLEWMADNHFTFLGYIEYTLAADGDRRYLEPAAATGLGLLRELPLGDRVKARTALTEGTLRRLRDDRLLRISKSDHHSTVHRDVHMDLISIKRLGEDGEVTGELRFLGLFTSMVYSIAARNIPLVKDKVRRVVERTGFLPNAHKAKVMRHIVENYPRDELFQISEKDLYRFSMRILSLQLRPRLALMVRLDEEERFVSCMVFVPRERQSTRTRKKLQRILEESFGGKVSAFFTRIGDRPLAQLQFIIHTKPGAVPDHDVEVIEERMNRAIQSWTDRLHAALRDQHGELSHDLWERYGEAFSRGYQDHNTFLGALGDIPLLEDVLTRGELRIRLYRTQGASSDRFHLRTFELAVSRDLSDFLPILENMGLMVASEFPYEVRPEASLNPVWIRDFEVVALSDVDLEAVHESFEEALRQVYLGHVENDGFNRLVLTAGLSWRQVVLLRAYCKYLRQTGIAFSESYMQLTLGANPRISKLLIDLFQMLFDPARQDGIDREQLLLGELHQGLENVSSLDEDRILRRYLNLVQSTLRTNFYQTGEDGLPKDYVSIKFDAQKVMALPKPRPAYEIFVYSPRFEAVHLRGGKVARGGIRWSDRREDFRTEILGLVKSQMVKNAVIVPVGAKGGFVLKRPPAGSDRDAFLAEGKACYQAMIRGLLDITDNLKSGEVMPPPDVVRRDEDDTYLVVAADKGTATFSDLANEVAGEYDFWLGDAFASGGSRGYDHKKMGITARGAWESVKRHFREMGRDTQSEPFTCVGVGDMSGDVFGNGLLLSEHGRLVAAFNHLHIFVDPNPGPEAFAERQRLFELPRSSWTDYDRARLSEGGDIFDRHAKRLTVSAQVKELLGLTANVLPPNDLLRAILRAKVDLLWFGGIGTYVRADFESNASAGDRSNDEIRVTAKELRCRVIGEGANLGTTQRGRVQFALAGGRLNTDFIDNSGGVDCSDHEVNIKIALREAQRAGELDTEARDQLLIQMTDEVSALVLKDNYLQAQSISLEIAQGVSLLGQHTRLMNALARREGLDRSLEVLPDDATLSERREKKRGLTRPEISVLLALSKISVYNGLLDSDLPDDPSLTDDLLRYFPKPMEKRFRPHLLNHRLRREIVATHVTNSMVNRLGTTFVNKLREETGHRVADIARAYTAARDVFELRDLWSTIERLDNKVSNDLQVQMMQIINRAVADVCRWFLRHGGQPFQLGELLENFQDGIVVVAAQLEELLPPNARSRVRRRYKKWVDNRVPHGAAGRIAVMEFLPSACDVARSAHHSGEAVERCGRIYFSLGERLGFDRFRRAAELLPKTSIYLQTAVTALVDDLSSHQTEIARQVSAFDGRAKAAIQSWAESRPDAVARLDSIRDDLGGDRNIDLAMLTIAERELRRLAEM
ncbi:MAG: NAD-glutamate dehydrogenase [Acidobacteriota bacterium]